MQTPSSEASQEQQMAKSRPGAHLLRHEISPAVAAAAAAELGGTGEEAACAACALRQPALRNTFQRVFTVHTKSGNSEWMRGKLLQAIGYDARWRPATTVDKPAQDGTTGSSDCGSEGSGGDSRRCSVRPRRPRAPVQPADGSDGSEQSLQRTASLKKKAAPSSGGQQGSPKRPRQDASKPSPFAAAAQAAARPFAHAGHAPLVVVVVPDWMQSSTPAAAAQAVAAAAAGATALAWPGCGPWGDASPRHPTASAATTVSLSRAGSEGAQASAGIRMELAAQTALKALGWGPSSGFALSAASPRSNSLPGSSPRSSPAAAHPVASYNPWAASLQQHAQLQHAAPAPVSAHQQLQRWHSLPTCMAAAPASPAQQCGNQLGQQPPFSLWAQQVKACRPQLPVAMAGVGPTPLPLPAPPLPATLAPAAEAAPAAPSPGLPALDSLSLPSLAAGEWSSLLGPNPSDDIHSMFSAWQDDRVSLSL